MHRRGYDLYLARYADEGWRCTFFTTGKEHSLTSTTGSAWEPTPWLAVQRAAARALDKLESQGLVPGCDDHALEI
jgi:hypothetical protein